MSEGNDLEGDWNAKADEVEAAILEFSMDAIKGVAEIDMIIESLDPESRAAIEPICKAYGDLTLKFVNGIQVTGNTCVALARSAAGLAASVKKHLSDEDSF